jgi:glycerol-3-phosphate acyltransferase PlsY
MGSIVLSVFVIILAYLCGSLCSAIIVSRIFSLPDPCQEGSKNPGATNVLRLAGKKYAAIVMLGDTLKGLLPVVLANILEIPPEAIGFTCLAAVLGHMYPIFFNFKGGKGVATALGAFLGLHFIMGVVVIATWLLVANITRYSSMASMVSITLAPLFSIVSLGNLSSFPPLLMIAALVLYKHRNNITRLMDGQEPKLKFRHHQLSDVAEDLLVEPKTSHKAKRAEVAENEPVVEAPTTPEESVAPEAPAVTKKPAPRKRKTTPKEP